MILRSLLFVPGDSERKLAKSESSRADALVLDLEDAVAADRTEVARTMVLEYLRAHRDRSSSQLWVRINPLSTPKATLDLAAIVARRSRRNIASESHLGQRCRDARSLPVRSGSARGRRAGIDRDHSGRDRDAGCDVRARRFRRMQSAAVRDDLGRGRSRGRGRRDTNRDAAGNLEFTYQLARSLCLLAAVAAEVQPIDTVSVNFKDAMR